MKKMVNGVISDMEPEEITQREAEAQRFEAEERHRPLSEQEIDSLLRKSLIQFLTVDDQIAVRMMQYYPEWANGTTYKIDFKVQKNNKLYKCRQEHTSQPLYAPGQLGTESLWTVINEHYSGDQYDPIPYSGNMVLEKGKYYIENDIAYLCNRSSGQAVFNPLKDLIGLYVKKV